MTTGAFSRNVSKLFSELKLVTDNLSIYAAATLKVLCLTQHRDNSGGLVATSENQHAVLSTGISVDMSPSGLKTMSLPLSRKQESCQLTFSDTLNFS